MNLINLENAAYLVYVSNAYEKYIVCKVKNDKNGILTRITTTLNGNLLRDEGSASFSNCNHFSNNLGCLKVQWPKCKDVTRHYFSKNQGAIYGNCYIIADTSNFSVFECEEICKNNCSCYAYACTNSNRTRVPDLEPTYDHPKINKQFRRNLYYFFTQMLNYITK